MISRLRAFGRLTACLMLGGCGSWLGEPPQPTLISVQITAPEAIPPGVDRQ